MSNTIGLIESESPSRRNVWLVALAVGLWLVAALLLVARPEHVLVSDVIVDDAIYFAAPARHLLDGHGFSFDKLEPTNGVQALWALVTIGLAALFEDRLLLLRAMALLSGLCWLGAAGVAFAVLRRSCHSGAWVAAVGLAACGLSDRLAFQGMENGLHVLLSAGVLWAGFGWVRAGFSRRWTLGLGLLLALFALSRTEGVLLGLMLGIGHVAGLYGGERTTAVRLRDALLLAVPGVLLVGGFLVFSRLYFGLWTPISGEVKSFYESTHGRDTVHGPFWQNLGWHVKFVRDLAFAPITGEFRTLLSHGLGWSAAGSWSKRLLWILLAVGLVLSLWRGFALRRAWRGIPAVACVFGLHAVVHLVLMGSLLPHYTEYGTWYFSTEVLALWLGAGVLFAQLRSHRVPWLGRLLCLGVIAVVVVGVSAGQLRGLKEDPRTSRFLEAGRWLERQLPAGETAGALSSGLVAWYAPSLHVVNLDGLMNTRSYLEDVLRPGRLATYFAKKGITWFADYQHLSGWKSGITWRGNLPRERLVPREYWRMGEEHAYVIWKVLPPGAGFAVLGEHQGLVRNRRAELLLAADVDGRFPVIRHRELSSSLAEHSDHVVAASFPSEPELELWHVLVPRAQLAELGFRAGQMQPQRAATGALDGALRLLGHEVIPSHIAAGRPVIVTLYWAPEAEVSAEELRLELQDASGQAQSKVMVGRQHGTYPVGEWMPGRVVPETVSLLVPEGVALEELRLVLLGVPGSARLQLSLFAEGLR